MAAADVQEEAVSNYYSFLSDTVGCSVAAAEAVEGVHRDCSCNNLNDRPVADKQQHSLDDPQDCRVSC